MRSLLIRSSVLPVSLRRFIAAVTALVLFADAGLLHAAEANIWSERRKAASGRSLAGTPADLRASLPALLSGSIGAAPAPVVSFPEHLKGAGDAGLEAKLHRIPEGLRRVPSSLGEIVDVRLSSSPSAPLVVLIQDAHQVHSAQRSIDGLLRRLEPDVIGIEGSAGPFLIPAYRRLPDQSLQRDVADGLFEANLLTGAEHYGLTGEKEAFFWGLEEPSLYMENVDAYRRGLAVGAEADRAVQDLQRSLDARKDKAYSAAMKAFDEWVSSYESRGSSLSKYVRWLCATPGLSLPRFPEVSRFENALRLESSLDFSAVEKERTELVRRLAESLPQEELDPLVRASAAFRAGEVSAGAYYGYFHRTLASAGVALPRFPAFDAYVRYALAADRVRPAELFTELDGLKREAARLLARTAEEKEIFALQEDLRLVKGLLGHQLNADQWRLYESRKAAQGGRPAQSLLAPFEDFYRAASRRDAVLANRFLSRLTARKAASGALVAGGFHAEGLRRQLTARGASVVTLMPRLQDVPENPVGYLDVFGPNRTPLEKMLLGEKLTTNPQSTTTKDSLDPSLDHTLGVGHRAMPALNSLSPANARALGVPVLEERREAGSRVTEVEVDGVSLSVVEAPENPAARLPGGILLHRLGGRGPVAIGKPRPSLRGAARGAVRENVQPFFKTFRRLGTVLQTGDSASPALAALNRHLAETWKEALGATTRPNDILLISFQSLYALFLTSLSAVANLPFLAARMWRDRRFRVMVFALLLEACGRTGLLPGSLDDDPAGASGSAGWTAAGEAGAPGTAGAAGIGGEEGEGGASAGTAGAGGEGGAPMCELGGRPAVPASPPTVVLNGFLAQTTGSYDDPRLVLSNADGTGAVSYPTEGLASEVVSPDGRFFFYAAYVPYVDSHYDLFSLDRITGVVTRIPGFIGNKVNHRIFLQGNLLHVATERWKDGGGFWLDVHTLDVSDAAQPKEISVIPIEALSGNQIFPGQMLAGQSRPDGPLFVLLDNELIRVDVRQKAVTREGTKSLYPGFVESLLIEDFPDRESNLYTAVIPRELDSVGAPYIRMHVGLDWESPRKIDLGLEKGDGIGPLALARLVEGGGGRLYAGVTKDVDGTLVSGVMAVGLPAPGGAGEPRPMGFVSVSYEGRPVSVDALQPSASGVRGRGTYFDGDFRRKVFFTIDVCDPDFSQSVVARVFPVSDAVDAGFPEAPEGTGIEESVILTDARGRPTQIILSDAYGTRADAHAIEYSPEGKPVSARITGVDAAGRGTRWVLSPLSDGRTHIELAEQAPGGGYTITTRDEGPGATSDVTVEGITPAGEPASKTVKRTTAPQTLTVARFGPEGEEVSKTTVEGTVVRDEWARSEEDHAAVYRVKDASGAESIQVYWRGFPVSSVPLGDPGDPSRKPFEVSDISYINRDVILVRLTSAGTDAGVVPAFIDGIIALDAMGVEIGRSVRDGSGRYGRIGAVGLAGDGQSLSLYFSPFAADGSVGAPAQKNLPLSPALLGLAGVRLRTIRSLGERLARARTGQPGLRRWLSIFFLTIGLIACGRTELPVWGEGSPIDGSAVDAGARPGRDAGPGAPGAEATPSYSLPVGKDWRFDMFAPQFFDLDGDHVPEIIGPLGAEAGSRDGRIGAWTQKGKLLWSKPRTYAGSSSEPVVAALSYVDGAGQTRRLLAFSSKTEIPRLSEGNLAGWVDIFLTDENGKDLPGWPIRWESTRNAPDASFPALADATGDGIPEVLVPILHSLSAGIRVMSLDGTMIGEFPLDSKYSSPAYGELDPESPGVEMVWSTGDAVEIYAGLPKPPNVEYDKGRMTGRYAYEEVSMRSRAAPAIMPWADGRKAAVQAVWVWRGEGHEKGPIDQIQFLAVGAQGQLLTPAPVVAMNISPSRIGRDVEPERSNVSDPVVGDWDGDGRLDLIVVAKRQEGEEDVFTVHVLKDDGSLGERNGQVIARCPHNGSYYDVATPVLTEANAQPGPDLVFGVKGAWVTVDGRDGSILSQPVNGWVGAVAAGLDPTNNAILALTANDKEHRATVHIVNLETPFRPEDGAWISSRSRGNTGEYNTPPAVPFTSALFSRKALTPKEMARKAVATAPFTETAVQVFLMGISYLLMTQGFDGFFHDLFASLAQMVGSVGVAPASFHLFAMALTHVAVNFFLFALAHMKVYKETERVTEGEGRVVEWKPAWDFKLMWKVGWKNAFGISLPLLWGGLFLAVFLGGADLNGDVFLLISQFPVLAVAGVAAGWVINDTVGRHFAYNKLVTRQPLEDRDILNLEWGLFRKWLASWDPALREDLKHIGKLRRLLWADFFQKPFSAVHLPREKKKRELVKTLNTRAPSWRRALKALIPQTSPAGGSPASGAGLLDPLSGPRPESVHLTSNLNQLAAFQALVTVPEERLSQEEARRALWDLFTGTVSLEAPEDLSRIVNALRQEPMLLVRAASELSRYEAFGEEWILPLISAMADLSFVESRQAVVDDIQRIFYEVRKWNRIYSTLDNPGVAYVEARGAERDLPLLHRLDQLTRNEDGVVYMTVNGDFRDVLRSLRADGDHELLVSSLEDALSAGRLRVVSVQGDAPEDPVHVVALADQIPEIDALQKLNAGFLVLAANPALLDLSRVERVVRFLVQTLNGRTIQAIGDFQKLIEEDQKIRRYA